MDVDKKILRIYIIINAEIYLTNTLLNIALLLYENIQGLTNNINPEFMFY